jgi:AcrR family transcriptional regulator
MPRFLSDEDVTEFRARLCAAGERLFAAQGAEAVTMRQLAAVLGVSPMTPYRYFKDKDEILAAVRAAAFNRFAGALEAARNPADGGAVESSVRVANAYTKFAVEEPQAYQLMFDLRQPNEESYPELAAAAARARRTMSAHVRDLMAAGLLEGDAELIGHVFWSMLHGIIVLQMAGKISSSVDGDALRAMGMAVVGRGLGLVLD